MHLRLALICAASAIVVFATPALAGGWAVTTLDPLPTSFEAGQTYRIGYTIRQHGVTPYRGATPEIRVHRGMMWLSFRGSPDGAPGHYVSEVRLPADGTWTWSVDQSPFAEQALGTIDITAATTATTAPTEDAPGFAAGLAICGAIVMLLFQVKRVTTPAAITATDQIMSRLTHARRKTITPNFS
jgi:hypothetical protein